MTANSPGRFLSNTSRDEARCVIAVDARTLVQTGNGISRFLFETLSELANEPRLRFILFSHKPLHPANALPLETIIDRRWSRIPGTIWILFRLNRLAVAKKAFIVWGPAHVLPFRNRALRAVLTVHDLVYRIMPQSMSWWNRLVARALVDRSIKNADVLATDSQATYDDMMRMLHVDPPSKKVIHLARRARPVPTGATERGGDAEPYLFALGSIEPRKNVDGLLACFDALSEFCPEIGLRMAGAHSWKSDAIMKRFARDGAGDRLSFLGFLSDDAVAEQMLNAKAFVMPSHYEGFGLPVIEAVGLAPIIVSDIPVFRELGEYIEGICFVDFSDAKAAAERISTFLSSEPPPARFINGGEEHFSWARVARDYAEAFVGIEGQISCVGRPLENG